MRRILTAYDNHATHRFHTLSPRANFIHFSNTKEFLFHDTHVARQRTKKNHLAAMMIRRKAPTVVVLQQDNAAVISIAILGSATDCTNTWDYPMDDNLVAMRHVISE